MKRKNILLSFGLAALIFGAGAGIALKTVNKGAVETNATTEGYVDVYLYLGSCNWASKENAKMYAYFYESSTASTGWTGNQMTQISFFGYSLYKAEVPADAGKVIFNVNGWDGDCQTVNLDFDSSKTLWSITSSYTDGRNQTASCQSYLTTKYVLDKTNSRLLSGQKCHLWKDGVSGSGTQWPGLDMTLVSGHIYSYSYLSFLDKAIFNDGIGNQTGNLTIGSNECAVLEDDIVDDRWVVSSWTSLAAAQFIDGYMHFNDVSTSTGGHTENCDAYYSAAKSAYNSLSISVQKDALAVQDVKARLSNWATAHGDILNPEGGNLAKFSLGGLSTDNSSLVVTITSIGVLSLASVIGFAFIKRRKVNR